MNQRLPVIERSHTSSGNSDTAMEPLTPPGTSTAVDGRRDFVWRVGHNFLVAHWIPSIEGEKAYTASVLV